ncbi:MAG: hypothetical protein AB1489_28860, partial [Acidobacteriota bacterium]
MPAETGLTTQQEPASGVWQWLECRADTQILLVLVLVSFAIFANTLGNGFVLDDHLLIERNRAIREKDYYTTVFANPYNYDASWLDMQSWSISYYRPFPRLLGALAFQAFGLQTYYYHLLCLIVYFGVVALAYGIIKQLSGRRVVAAVGALLFAIHPLHSEAVAWFNCLFEPLHALFFLSAFLLYLHAQAEGKTRRGGIFYLGALTLLAAALLTKEAALCFPILIASHKFIETKAGFFQRLSAAVRASLPFLFVVASYLMLRYCIYNGALRMGGGVPQYVILSMPRVIVEYLRMLVLPIGSSIVHNLAIVSSPTNIQFWLLLLLLLAATFFIYRYGPSRIQFACAWMLITMLPILNISAFIPELKVQDRYTFLPSLGFSALVAMALIALSENGILIRAHKLIVIFLIVLAGCLSGLTIWHNSFWKNDLTLFQRAIAVDPNSEFVQCNYAAAL